MQRSFSLLSAHSKIGGWPKVSTRNTFSIGDHHSSIQKIKKRLVLSGHLPSINNNEKYLFNDSLLKAIKRFQRQHALNPTGYIDELTLEKINISVDDMIVQLLANLEQYRWMPSNLSSEYIVVNILNCTLDYVVNGDVVENMKVVVGKPSTPTPFISSKIRGLTLNPKWGIPTHIFVDEILPSAKKNPEKLKRMNIAIIKKGKNSFNSKNLDFVEKKPYAYTYIQKPGPKNALGLYKFIFANGYKVSLHDTPFKRLFKNT